MSHSPKEVRYYCCFSIYHMVEVLALNSDLIEEVLLRCKPEADSESEFVDLR